MCTKKLLSKRQNIQKLIAFALALLPFLADAQSVKVAVAANLQGVIKVLQADFLHRTGIDIEPIIGASGNLTNQIKNGAPFDVFLSADMDFPQTLYQQKFTSTKPVIYALGSLIVCSNKNLPLNYWDKLLQSNTINKIAIANPKTAPYGKAAMEALQKKGVFEQIKSKIVYGESISQVNIYIRTGAVQVGFTTEALITDARINKINFYWKRVEPTLYQPIKQGMVILKHGAGNQMANKFFIYVQSKSAQNIFKQFGYLGV